MRERRVEQRYSVSKEACIVIDGERFAECLVRDLSPNGARLVLAGAVELPDAFTLTITSADLRVPAAPVWRSGEEAGIRFTGAGRSGEVDDTPHRLITPILAGELTV